MKILKYLGLAIVFVWFMGGGIAHFTSTDFFLHIMPDWLPWHLELVYVSGVLEILGALGLLIPRTRSLAGICLIALTIAVTPVNIHMFMNAELYADVTQAQLGIRLIIQVILLALIWWSTRPVVRTEP